MFLLLFLIFFQALRAQENDEKVLLVSILQGVQGQFGYQFNYAKDTVENMSIIPPSTEFSFIKTLDYLRQTTGLEFTIVGDFFVFEIGRPAWN